MKPPNSTRTKGWLAVAVGWLALSLSACGPGSPPPRVASLDASAIGLRVTEHATLPPPIGVRQWYDSIAFSRDGERLAVTHLHATRRANRDMFAVDAWKHEVVLDTFRVDDFSRVDTRISQERENLFHVFVNPTGLAGPDGQSAPFLLASSAFHSTKEIVVSAGAPEKPICSLALRSRDSYSDRPRFPLNGVAVAPNSPVLAVAMGQDHDLDRDTPPHGEVVAWDLVTGEERIRFHSAKIAFWDVAFSPDGRFLAAGGGAFVGVRKRSGAYREVYRGELHLWELETGELLFRTESPGLLGSLAFSPDGLAIAAGCNEGPEAAVRFYHTLDGRETGFCYLDALDLIPPIGIEDLAFSPNGEFLAVGVGSHNRGWQWGELRVLNVATKQAGTGGFRRHSQPVTHVAFSPDGKWLVASAIAGSVKVFSVESLDPDNAEGTSEEQPPRPSDPK